MESVGKAGHTVTEGNSSSRSLTRSIELTPGLSSQSLKKLLNFKIFQLFDVSFWPLFRAHFVKTNNILICIVNEEGKQTHRTANKDHPDNSVKKIFSIHKVSDAMNG